MFLAGLETDWHQLLANGRAAFVSATAGVILPLIAGYGLAIAFGLPPVEALFVDIILTATSVSITASTRSDSRTDLRELKRGQRWRWR